MGMGQGQVFDILTGSTQATPPNTCPGEDVDDKFEISFFFCSETTWPRLQSSLEKPHWISVDFERFEYQDDSEPEAEEEGEEEQGEIMDPEKLKRMVCLISFVDSGDILSKIFFPISVIIGGDQGSTKRV